MNNNNDRQTALNFFKKHFIKSDTKVCGYSSYRLKHILQDSTNVYFTEQDFNKLMERQGYQRSPRGKWKMCLSKELTKYIKDRERGLV